MIAQKCIIKKYCFKFDQTEVTQIDFHKLNQATDIITINVNKVT